MLMLRMNTFVELGCSEFREETIPIYTESCHPSLGSSTILRRFVLKICHILNWDVLFNTVCISVLYSKFVFVFLHLLCSSTSYSTAQRCCAETLANALSEPKWQSWVFKAASKTGGSPQLRKSNLFHSTLTIHTLMCMHMRYQKFTLEYLRILLIQQPLLTFITRKQKNTYISKALQWTCGF